MCRATALLALALAGGAASASPPQNASHFSDLMTRWVAKNESLLAWALPTAPVRDIASNWAPYTADCEISTDCWCFHVAGADMSRHRNPDGFKQCLRDNNGIKDCSSKKEKAKTCACLAGPSCLFSDMRPVKILSAIAAARAAGVKTIIEEGRFGGLSALMYASHGFDVVSVEFLPLAAPSSALRAHPQIRLLDGDGSVLLPSLVANMTDAEARTTMVVFDGEKRAAAWKTYKKLADRVALAVFDDTNVKPGQWDSWRPPKGTVAWTTQDEQFAPMLVRERPALALLEPLKTKELQGVRFQGGLQALTQFHFTIVRGGGWRSGGIDFAHSQSP